MLRNPYDWAFAMWRNCWCKKKEQFAAMDFFSFMTMPWADNCPKPWNGETRKGTCVNLMACRAAKLLNFYNMSHWAPNVEFVRHEDVLTHDASVAWLAQLARKYHLRLRLDVSAVGHYTSVPHLTDQKTAFDPLDVVRASVWFHPELAAGNATLRVMVDLVTHTMDKTTESMAGYRPLQLNSRS